MRVVLLLLCGLSVVAAGPVNGRILTTIRDTPDRAVAVDRHSPVRARQDLVQAATTTTTAATDPFTLTPLQLANRDLNEDAILKNIRTELEATEQALQASAAVIQSGLCAYKGFCEVNPALSCDAIAKQDRISTSIGTATLPDGLYWLGPNPDDYPGVNAVKPDPVRTMCKFDSNGDGWTQMFDDWASSEVLQQPVNEIVSKLKFRQVWVHTNDMITKNNAGVIQTVYWVDPTGSGGGKTLQGMHDYGWGGQDQWGQVNDQGGNYPNSQVHYRWKYFGQMQSTNTYRATIFIMDDGDVEDSCKVGLDLANQCGQEFFCDSSNVPSGRVAQTALPKTRQGIISFGCSSSSEKFTQCGTCSYEGPDDDFNKAQQVRTSVVQRMYVK